MKLGKFKILEEIGRGGFGIVYKAKDVTLDRIVALKVLLPEHLDNADLVEAFKREARHMAKISHPNVIQIHEVGEVDDQIFIAMQHCVGGSLEQKINNSGPMRVQDAIRTLYQVAHGLDAGHRIGLIHRDIKPSNILFNASGEAAIGDFGISKAVLSTDQTGGHTFNQFSGTPFYVPPELWQGKDLPTPAADIYSLACVFYEMITGEVLFAGDTFVHVLSRHMLEAPVFSDKLPRQLVDLLSVALAKKPEDRFQTISEFLSAVRQSFVGSAKTGHQTEAATVLPGEKPKTVEKPISEDLSFTQIVRRSQKTTGNAGTGTAQESNLPAPQIKTGSQSRLEPHASNGQPVVGSVPLSGQHRISDSNLNNYANPQKGRSEPNREGERKSPRGKAPFLKNLASWLNKPIQNQAAGEQKRNRKPLFPLVAIALVAVAAIIVGSFWIKNNIATSNTVLTLTNLPSPTSGATPTYTPMISVPQGTLKFASMGSMVDGIYQSYSAGGPSNPRWSESGLETWNPVEESQEITLEPASGDIPAEAIDIQTYADVGLMLSLGARGQVNSSVFIYGSSDVKLTYTDILEMELRQGTVFLKLESRSEIAQITLPNHQNAIARLTGGSMLLHLNGDEVQLWCLKDDCSLEFALDSERTFAVQRQSYFPAAGTVDPPMDIIPAHYDELWAYNIKCNRCMDVNVVPEPTPTATPTSTPWPTNTWRPSDTPKRATNPPSISPTPTATRTSTPWNITPPTPTFTRTFTPTNTPSPVPKTWTVSVSASPSGGGSVGGGGVYQDGTSATITASPNAGYRFTGWSGAYGGTEPSYTFTVNGNVSFTANFELIPITYYTVTLYVDPKNSGNTSGAGTYAANTLVTISATPRDANWNFLSWSGDYIGTDNPHSFPITANMTITANFDMFSNTGAAALLDQFSDGWLRKVE